MVRLGDERQDSHVHSTAPSTVTAGISWISRSRRLLRPADHAGARPGPTTSPEWPPARYQRLLPRLAQQVGQVLAVERARRVLR